MVQADVAVAAGWAGWAAEGAAGWAEEAVAGWVALPQGAEAAMAPAAAAGSAAPAVAGWVVGAAVVEMVAEGLEVAVAAREGSPRAVQAAWAEEAAAD